MQIGYKVRFTKTLVIEDTTRIEAGETGVIERAYPDMFGLTVWVRLDIPHLDLIDAGYPQNRVWFNDYTERLSDCVELIDDRTQEEAA